MSVESFKSRLCFDQLKVSFTLDWRMWWQTLLTLWSYWVKMHPQWSLMHGVTTWTRCKCLWLIPSHWCAAEISRRNSLGKWSLRPLAFTLGFIPWGHHVNEIGERVWRNPPFSNNRPICSPLQTLAPMRKTEPSMWAWGRLLYLFITCGGKRLTSSVMAISKLCSSSSSS